MGYRVIETVGKNVIKLDFAKGFCAQFATAFSIVLGTQLGIPLSTTHCMIGSLFGIVMGGKLSVVKKAYDLDAPDGYRELPGTPGIGKQEGQETAETQTGDAEPKHELSSFNRKTVGKILIWWGATVPVALGVSWGITAAMLAVYT